MEQAKFAEAEPLLVAGYRGMAQRKAVLPRRRIPTARRRVDPPALHELGQAGEGRRMEERTRELTFPLLISAKAVMMSAKLPIRQNRNAGHDIEQIEDAASRHTRGSLPGYGIRLRLRLDLRSRRRVSGVTLLEITQERIDERV